MLLFSATFRILVAFSSLGPVDHTGSACAPNCTTPPCERCVSACHRAGGSFVGPSTNPCDCRKYVDKRGPQYENGEVCGQTYSVQLEDGSSVDVHITCEERRG
jgi:hypothetical protein